MVNSAYYGLPYGIGSIHQAVTILGINAIRNIAISTSVHEVFNRHKGSAAFNLKRFWRHSLKCAVLSRLIAKKIGYSQVEEAFLAGLLHDIGRLVLSVNFFDPPMEPSRALDSEQDWLLDKENRLGATHSEIGAYLLNQWNFQPFMADAVLYHHEAKSMISNALPLVQIVHAANLLSQGFDEEEQGIRVAEELFGFQGDEIVDFLFQTDEETEQVAQLLQIEIEQPKKPSKPFSENDLAKRKDLAGTVERISLLFGTLRNFLEAEDQEALLKSVHQGLQILFEVDRCILFLRDAGKDCLVGKSATQDRHLANINGTAHPHAYGKEPAGILSSSEKTPELLSRRTRRGTRNRG